MSAEALARHARTLARLEGMVDAASNARDDETTAQLAKVAAQYAHWNHAGVLASVPLERALAGMGARLPTPPARRRSRPTSSHVLHVLTEAYELGGHSRQVWRWMATDSERRHSAVLTDQPLDVPPQLAAAVAERRGSVHVLDPSRPLTERARQLRALTHDADVVALHIHPWDPVPAIALGHPSVPPVVLVNIGDAMFWLGLGAVDVVASNRSCGIEMSIDRRGVPAERNALLPIPLERAPRGPSRGAARARLGIADDQVLLLTVASPYKYDPVDGGRGFLELVVPVLSLYPQTTLIAVGPTGADVRWRAAAAWTAGRMRAVGYQLDLRDFHAASDVYVDAYPIPSITSYLETGLHGTPVVAYLPAGAESQFACADPALRDPPLRTLDDFHTAVGRLVTDPEHRRREGARLRRAVTDVHTAAGWLTALEQTYELAAGVGKAHPLAPSGPTFEPFDHLLVGYNEHPPWPTDLDSIITAQMERHPNALPVDVLTQLKAIAESTSGRGGTTSPRRRRPLLRRGAR